MGSSTKKHKKDKDVSRKRRHHSRSRSRSRSLEPPEKYKREHKKHRHDKKREKHDRRHLDYESADSDCVEVPPAPQISAHSPPTPPSPPRCRSFNDKSEDEEGNVGHKESLSIEETNKLRAKLGLKPLEVSSNTAPSNDGKIVDDLGEFYHAPAKNLSKTNTEKKLRDKLEIRKEKRALEKRLASVKTLGESDEDDDAAAWVNKNREIQKQKEEASKRAKLLEEMDAVFGVGELVAEDLQSDKKRVYNAKHLKGLRVEHDAEMFKEGKDIILTLKDQDILEDQGDALVNVNILDDERYIKSNENKKQKPNQYGYDAYDDTIDPENRTLLAKYDEVIDSDKNIAKNTFTIGEKIEKRNTIDSVKAKLNNKRLESLNLPELKLASEYFTPEEIAFKKPKKKVRKIRQKPKMLKADDLLAMDNSNNSWLKDLGHRRPKPEQDVLITDDTDVPTDIKDIKFEPEVDNELELALSKARKLKQQEGPRIAPLDVKIEIKEEAPLDGAIVLNSTAEFCRSLGEIPTYGLAGNRDEEPNDLMEYEPSASPPHVETNTKEGSWSKVTDKPEVAPPAPIITAPILEDEPNIGWGVSGALKLAMSKGYLEKEDQNRPSSSRFAHLQAKNYSIEDKSFGDDEKFGGRRERYAGPTTDFKEKDGFKPNVKLDYIDDDGHVLSAKEAFRYLSHKFHGKGPGKNKVEKRIKKNEQEGLMKKMSSTDTPLGTLGMLQAKQKETHSAYVVLSGNKHMQGTTIISKNKR